MSSSSDTFLFDGSAYRHSSSTEMASPDPELQFYSDCLNPFPESPIDILQAISDDTNQQKSFESCPSHDPKAPSATLLSSSPPSNQLQNLSLTHFQTLGDSSSSPNGYADFSAFEVKTEENHHHNQQHQQNLGFETAINPSFPSFFYDESVAKMMQRSFSSNSFDRKPTFLLQTHFDTLLESPSFQTQDSNFPTGSIRRACSTGDLQVKATETSQSSFIEEAANFKVGRYSAEERKERIHRYRAKRNLRNFNKTIKYACRKTLADNRPRIRGRFARNDEIVENPKPTCSNRFQDEEEVWIDGLHGEDYDGVRIGPFFNSFGHTKIQYYTPTMAIDN